MKLFKGYFDFLKDDLSENWWKMGIFYQNVCKRMIKNVFLKLKLILGFEKYCGSACHSIYYAFILCQLYIPNIAENKDTYIHTSFESPYIGRLESAKNLGVASYWGWPRPLNWKSTTFTRTHLEPLMTKILPASKLLSNDTL